MTTESKPSSNASQVIEGAPSDCDDVDAMWPITSPTIESEAPTTRPAGTTCISLAVGLRSEMVRLCAYALGDAVEIVPTSDAAAACYLLAILRPRLVVVTSSLSDAEGARLTAAAAVRGAQLVCIGPSASAAAIVWLLQRSAAVAFGTVAPRP